MEQNPFSWRGPLNWPRLVFIFVPLLIVTVPATVLVCEHLQPETEKAIRLVRESHSRKENFTIQQYLYATVYHRKAGGEPVTIEGWRATPASETRGPLIVEFSYEDSDGKHDAMWEAVLEVGLVIPKNQAALDLSWH